MNDEVLQSMAATFPPDYRAFVESDYVDAFANKIRDEQKLDEHTTTIVRNGFVLYLYFVVTDQELLQFMTEKAMLDTIRAELITNQFLTDLPAELVSNHSAIVDDLQSNPENTTETTYQSSQESLLQNPVAQNAATVQPPSQMQAQAPIPTPPPAAPIDTPTPPPR